MWAGVGLPPSYPGFHPNFDTMYAYMIRPLKKSYQAIMVCNGDHFALKTYFYALIPCQVEAFWGSWFVWELLFVLCLGRMRAVAVCSVFAGFTRR